MKSACAHTNKHDIIDRRRDEVIDGGQTLYAQELEVGDRIMINDRFESHTGRWEVVANMFIGKPLLASMTMKFIRPRNLPKLEAKPPKKQREKKPRKKRVKPLERGEEVLLWCPDFRRYLVRVVSRDANETTIECVTGRDLKGQVDWPWRKRITFKTQGDWSKRLHRCNQELIDRLSE